MGELQMNNLINYGLTDTWIEKSAQHSESVLGRVITVFNRERIDVVTEVGIISCKMTNRLLTELSGLVITGDWVCIRKVDESNNMIEQVLDRKNKFARRKAGTINEEQIIGVNLDRIFIVTAVDDDFNPRRLERYITQAVHDQIPTTIVLSKVDLTNNLALYEKVASEIHPESDVISISSHSGMEGLSQLIPRLIQGETIALVGSSGVGKSTIINTLFGNEIQRVNKVNEKTGKGGHTTTNKHLRAFDNGYLLLDTPGMREFGMLAYSDESGKVGGFDDIESWAGYCRYSNCRLDTESGCAVKQAVEDGQIKSKRLDNYKKINYEQNYLWVKGRRISKTKLKYGSKRMNNDRR